MVVIVRGENVFAFVTGDADLLAGIFRRCDPVTIHRTGRAAPRAPVNVTD